MKKVSFLFVVHFLSNLVWKQNEDGSIDTTNEAPVLDYVSKGNKFKLSQTYLTGTDVVRDLNRNIFSLITGIIAKSVHNAREVAAAIRTSGYKSATQADKLFNVFVQIDIDGVTQTYDLRGITMGADGLMTAKGIYTEMVRAVAGESELFDSFVKRQPEVAEQLAYMLKPFGINQESATKATLDVLTDTVSESIKELRAWKKEQVKTNLINSGIAEIKKQRKELKERNELMGSDGAAKGKQLIAESVEQPAEA